MNTLRIIGKVIDKIISLLFIIATITIGLGIIFIMIIRYSWWALLIVPAMLIGAGAWTLTLVLIILFFKYIYKYRKITGFFKWIKRKEEEQCSADSLLD